MTAPLLPIAWCPVCHGAGVIRAHQPHRPDLSRIQRCPVCHGMGAHRRQETRQ